MLVVLILLNEALELHWNNKKMHSKIYILKEQNWNIYRRPWDEPPKSLWFKQKSARTNIRTNKYECGRVALPTIFYLLTNEMLAKFSGPRMNDNPLIIQKEWYGGKERKREKKREKEKSWCQVINNRQSARSDYNKPWETHDVTDPSITESIIQEALSFAQSLTSVCRWALNRLQIDDSFMYGTSRVVI